MSNQDANSPAAPFERRRLDPEQAAFGEALAVRLPLAARRVAVLGPVDEALVGALQRRASLVAPCPTIEELATFLSGGGLDAIVLAVNGDDCPGLEVGITQAAGALGPRSFLIARMPTDPEGVQAVSDAAERAGLRPYETWPYQEPGTGLARMVCMLVPTGYDAVGHARACRESGRPEWGFQLLNAAVEYQFADLERRAAMSDEKLACLLAMDTPEDTKRRLLLFNGAFMIFYQVSEVWPTHHPAYLRQAAFWERLGDTDMAARLLRTVHRLAPNEEVSREVARLEGLPSAMTMPGDVALAGSRHAFLDAPAAPDWRPRLLFVTSPKSHYGLDVLYDGLCTVLGDENVVEFPWKPMLHGAPPPELEYYPCAVNRGGPELNLDQVVADLEQGRFDAVFWGDVDGRIGQEAARRLMQAKRATPLFLFDAQDECTDLFGDVLAWLGVPQGTGFFKREMLRAHDYGPRCRPFLFAYPDHLVPAEPFTEPRPEFLFWAGQRWCGLRNVYLDRVETLLGCRFENTYNQEEYVAALHRSRIGLSAFGAGFDTVRYWELPAHGCLLLSERLPIHTPYDFSNGESAIFFGDLPELEARLLELHAHPERIEPIARAGHTHFLQFHTGSARARQVLGWALDLIRNRPA